MCVCVCIHVCVYIYIYIYTYMHVCVYIYIYICHAELSLSLWGNNDNKEHLNILHEINRIHKVTIKPTSQIQIQHVETRASGVAVKNPSDAGVPKTNATTNAMRNALTASPPTKSFDFEGFDSSRLLILRGGNSHVR